MKAAPEFVLAGGLPTSLRFGLIAILACVGIALQLFASLFLGWLVLLAAVLLGAIRGKSNSPKVSGSGEWQNVTMDELEDARKLVAGSAEVSRSSAAYTLGSGAGCGLLFLMIVGVLVTGGLVGSQLDSGFAVQAFSPIAQGGSFALLFIIDGLTLLLPIWMFGRVRAWQPPNLKTRLDQILSIHRTISADPKLDFQPSLQVAKTKNGSVPMDVRLMVKIKDSDPKFMGIQVQTSLNDVQGTKYPYTYCVLIAKPQFRLAAKAQQVVEMPPRGGFAVGFLGMFADKNDRKEAKFPKLDDAVVEIKAEGDVEIAVVRQGTGGRGYTTTASQAHDVFLAAYELAYGVLGLP